MDAAAKDECISQWVINTANSLGPAELISPLRNGKRTISTKLLSPVGFAIGASTSPLSPASPRSQISLETLTFPDSLYTVEGLMWCGFTQQAATLLINEYVRLHDPVTMDYYVSRYIRRVNIKEAKGDWRKAMNIVGISFKLQTNIMNNEFSDLRCTQSLLFWLEEFIVSNILTMRKLNQRLTTNIRHLQGKQPTSSTHSNTNERSNYTITRPKHDTLCRATTASRLFNVFPPNGSTALEKTILLTQTANDFGNKGYGIMYYWTTQDFLAQRLAQYAGTCIQNPYEVVIMRLLVPQRHSQPEGKTWRLEYGDEWRRLLWYSHNRRGHPEDLRAKHLSHDVIIGPVSINATSEFLPMANWQEVTNEHVYKVKGRNGEMVEGTQHVFKMFHGMEALNNKVMVDLFRCWPEIEWLADSQTWV